VSDVRSVIEISNASLVDFSQKLERLQLTDVDFSNRLDENTLVLQRNELALQRVEPRLELIVQQSSHHIELLQRNKAGLDELHASLSRVTRSVSHATKVNLRYLIGKR